MNYMYGPEVAQKLITCECCEDTQELRTVPVWLMGGPNEDRFICRTCFIIWYDNSVTDSDEIGRRSREIKAKKAQNNQCC